MDNLFPQYDILIAGGGLSGLTLGLLLREYGGRIGIIEKDVAARHKVCGEYISNEVRPLLESILPSLDWKSLPLIRKFTLQDSTGRTTACDLPLGGFGVSRYLLESSLREELSGSQIDWIPEKVFSVERDNGGFLLQTRQRSQLRARLVVGAFGKRSILDETLKRDFRKIRSPWMGIKAHFTHPDFLLDQVSLHLFPGGYAGLSAVEKGVVNLCGLYRVDAFKELGTPWKFFEQGLPHNPGLEQFLERATPLFDKPLTISNIHFGPRRRVEGGVLMCGDSAGLIYPLSGNGMAMSVRSAWMLSKLLGSWMKGEMDVSEVGRKYEREWQRQFGRRLKAGSLFQLGMTQPAIARAGVKFLSSNSFLLPYLIKTTHGKPFPHGL